MLPEFVNMIATVTYDVEAVKAALIAMNPDLDITDEDVIATIEEWAERDSLGLEYVLLDQDGRELD